MIQQSCCAESNSKDYADKKQTNVPPINAIPISDKLVLAQAVVNKESVSVTAPPKRERRVAINRLQANDLWPK